MLDIPLMSNNIPKSDVDNLVMFLQNTDRFTNGTQVRQFEKAWSEWLGVRYSVFVNSGSSANYITLAAISEKNLEGWTFQTNTKLSYPPLHGKAISQVLLRQS